MRKIKFRVWSNTRNDWNNPSNNAVGGLGDIYWLGREYELETEDIVIEQYTGINDRNQKEIYEGDILEFNGERGFVHFCAGAFFIDGAGPMYDYVKSVTPDILEDWIVIGNIYENSHLLDYK